jgi:hypothetical protein
MFKKGELMRNKFLIMLSIMLFNSTALSNDTSGNCDTSCTASSDCTNSCFKNLRTAIHPRSQGANTARELVGWQWELYKPEMCENYGTGYIAFEYQRSFKDNKLADALFGSPTLSFAGSSFTDRAPNELLADNFGLAQTFRGSICLKPRIENYILDLGFYVGLDYWVQNLYLRFHAPFVHTRSTIDVNCGNAVRISSGSFQDDTLKQFPACYMGQEAVSTAETIKQALSGNFLFGDMQTPWCGGKFDFARRTRNGLADIDVILGYNLLNDDCYHFGIGAIAVLPTGKSRKNLFILDPVVGNGKHFELGGWFSAHTVLWSGEDSNLAMWLEGNVTHMFRSSQCRTFDLVNNGPFSRYLLLKEFDTNGTTYTYNGTLLNATCFTTRKVDVSLSLKGDAALKLAYRWCGVGVDVGYNIYGHSHETIELRCNACPADIDRRKFAIKGTTGTCCSDYPIAVVQTPAGPVNQIFPAGATFPAGSTEPAQCDTPLPTTSVVTLMADNSSQPTATAFAPGITQNGTISASDCGVCLTSGTVNEPIAVSQLTPTNGFTNSNNLQPTLLSVNDLDIASGQAHSVVTHKLFTHISYTWFDECGWNPQLGLGFEVEFDGNHNRSGCEQTGLNQWGAWIKGCLSF